MNPKPIPSALSEMAGVASLPIDRSPLTRKLYATDASMYEELPEGVAFPKDEQELQRVVEHARLRGLPITMRAAGTSLAGQTTGGGLVVDLSRHMDAVLELDPEGRTARVQPGVIRDSLNRAGAEHGLKFGPDTSTTNRCMIGGMVGNNSSGLFSIRYGTTREHVLRLRAILHDGSVAEFGPLSPEELQAKCALQTTEGEIYRKMLVLLREHQEVIQEHWPRPEVRRRNTGYALDRLCEMDPVTPGGRPFNLAELLCGSEGTLALVTEATVRLVPVEPESVLLVSQFDALEQAMHATVELVKHDPSAVELIDDVVIGATEGNLEQRRNRFFLKGSPVAVLFTQFDGTDHERVLRAARRAADSLNSAGLGYAHEVFEEEDKKTRIWDLRKAGLGLLMGLGKDAKTPTFAEDTAVRVDDLPAYIADFRELLARHGTKSVFYAHASVGELHLRPMLDLGRPDDIRRMQEMAADVARLVRSYRGSLSGEHGDGRARSPFIPIVLGERGAELLGWVKEIWDPAGRFNPGKIVNPAPMAQGLRAQVPDAPIPTAYHWRREGGFANALGLCNGAGVCRKLAESGGTMCPSYQATREERDSTRGRANVFRQLFTGQDPKGFDSEELGEALSLCLSCKACKSECPANVDMARMKAEYQNARHRSQGVPLGHRFFGDPATFYRPARLFPGLANRVLRSRFARDAMQGLLGVDRERPLPEFAPKPFMRRLRAERPDLMHAKLPDTWAPGDPAVVLAVDVFCDAHDPEIAFAAVQVLEAMGCRVIVPGVIDSGRTRISQGLLDEMPPLIRRNLDILQPFLEAGLPIVGLEPSEVLTFRDEYADLCPDGELEEVERLGRSSFLLEEFVAERAESAVAAGSAVVGAAVVGGTAAGAAVADPLPEVAVHGHCHAKALGTADRVEAALRAFGYRTRSIPAGCCGMAGSFGYGEGTADVSREIAGLKLLPFVERHREAIEKGELVVCAHGFSCRHQIGDLSGLGSVHPATLLARAAAAGTSASTT